MTTVVDLLVRGGLIADGGGGQPYVGDIAVVANRIVDIGKLDVEASVVIDASGKLVTPGFVDIHTHYDGQVTWENRILASSGHGVTTVVMGNCGVGFAPCHPEDREALIAMMEGVEDIPGIVMAEGIPWNWETFPEYLDFVGSRPYDIDVAAQLPHSALRVYVMGERAIRRESATVEDCARMQALTEEALEAGAIGFATSRLFFHRDRTGELIPSIGAEQAELDAIGAGLREAGTGVIEAVFNPFKETFDDDFGMIKRMAQLSGRPVSYSLAQIVNEPDQWKHALEATARARAEGVDMRAQVIARPTGMLLGLDLSFNPFTFYPSYQAIAHLPLDKRVAALRDPELKARIVAESPEATPLPVLQFLSRFDWLFRLGDPPIYEPPLDQSVAAIASREGRRPQEVAYDMILEQDGRAVLFQPIANFASGNLDVPLAMMKDPNTILGLGDGGAHYGMIMDSSYPTFMLTYWSRDRSGEQLPVAEVVKALASDTAEAVGLLDRGRIGIGYKADINVIDFERLHLHAPHAVRDLPAGGRRLFQSVDGISATIVSGEVVYREGVASGALPGRLVRGHQRAPQLAAPGM